MKTFPLTNTRCRALVTPEQGGRITSFRTLGPEGEGVEHVGAQHLQTWVKAGDLHTPVAGMLHLFHGKLHEKTCDVQPAAAAPERGCELSLTDEGIRFTRRLTLDPLLPLLEIHAEVANISAEPKNFQIEAFFNWSFGVSDPRKRVVTTLIRPGGAEHLYLPPYGHVLAEPHDTTGAVLALNDLEHRQTLLILPDRGWMRFMIYLMGGSNHRGLYSVEQKLERGQSLQASLRLALVSGAGAIDALSASLATGLLPEKAVWFTDEPIELLASLAPREPGPPRRAQATVTAAGVAARTVALEIDGSPYRGVSQRVTLPAGALPVGQTILETSLDGAARRTPIRVLDPAADTGPLVTRAAKPLFPIRAIHLIASQASNQGLTLDALKWLVENVVAPCGFNHVVWEFNHGLRLRSHPELAGEAAFSVQDVATLARFCRSLGIEPIAQQNLYGHQNETNLTRVHPELQEIAGNLEVYCPTHPKTRAMVADIVRELLEIFEARYFHLGHDEVQFDGGVQRVGVCPRCRARPPHEIFAQDVLAVHEIVASAGARSLMWGDMVIPPAYGGMNVNGISGEVYRALELLPRDLILVDWHYFPTENRQSTNYFLARGFEVWGAVAFHKEGVRLFAEHAAMAHLPAMMFTTWGRPDLANLPLEALLYAAQEFQDLDTAQQPVADEKITAAAYGLWRKWRKWNGK